MTEMMSPEPTTPRLAQDIPGLASYAFSEVARVAESMAAEGTDSDDKAELLGIVGRFQRAAQLAGGAQLGVGDAFRGLQRLGAEPLAATAAAQRRGRIYGAVAARRGTGKPEDLISTARCCAAWMAAAAFAAAGGARLDAEIFRGEATRLYEMVRARWDGQPAPQAGPTPEDS